MPSRVPPEHSVLVGDRYRDAEFKEMLYITTHSIGFNYIARGVGTRGRQCSSNKSIEASRLPEGKIKHKPEHSY